MRSTAHFGLDGLELVAAFLHGSTAWGEPDSWSDRDLLLVVDRSCARRAIIQQGEDTFDVLVMDEQALRKELTAKRPNNNRALLYAVSRGRNLVGDSAISWSLQRLARQIWQKGPESPGEEEVRMIRSATSQSLNFLGKASARSPGSEVWPGIALARRGVFLQHFVDAYCRLHRLWANSFHQLLREEESQYCGLQQHLRAVLVPGPQELGTDPLVIFGERILADCDRLLVGDQTGIQMRDMLERNGLLLAKVNG